ncbi:F-box DNA helicase 1-like [Uloborus diversus]|nr:F-box DNA helicase 1-like [Uloborus diversus]
MYYGTKYERPYYCNQFIVLRNPYGIIKAEDCFPILINFMADRYCRKPASDMSILLAANPLACLADAVVTERFPELQSKDTRPWCVFAVAMIISESVWDVYRLYKCLFTDKAETSIHDVTDAMYCVATFLLYFKNGVGLNHGLHYRVYHALYMIENNLPSEPLKKSLKIMKGLPGQQSIHSYSESSSKTNLTYEQLRILNHRFHPNQIIKIVALAGTGKTTTLLHFARLYPQVRYLNVMFNKAICEEAKSQFPPNVKCKTAHSLAYKVYGSLLKHKLVTRMRPHDLVTLLKYHASSTIQVHSYAKLVLYTLENFTVSADPEINKSHVPFHHRDVDKRLVSELDREKVFKDAVEIWKKMINKDDTSVKITHDVYLKLYQLSKPKLSEYNCIMVDEAQDCNPAMLDVVLSQKLPVILVGDPNQQIYGFRGANNALQSVSATHTYYLTKSFRFGPEIAYIASCCLEVLKLNSHETLVGSEKTSYTDGRVIGQYAIISRTNVTLFNEAVRICCLQNRKRYEPAVIHGAFAGGIRGYGFDQIIDIYNLRANSRTHSKFPVKDKFISRFKTFADLNNYAKNADDPDLLAKIELINAHDYKIVDYIKTIKEKCSHPIELASIVFSTAHKAKGLEFDTVSLTDDYQIGKVPVDINNPAWSEETSVLYVALTRAKKSLLLPEKLLKVLHIAQEKFEYPVSSKSVLQSEPSLKCINCQEDFVPHTTLVLKRRQNLLSSNRQIKGGALCMKCGTEPSTRPEIRVEMVVMYLDRTNDFHHQSMSALIGPLPGDPPINRSVEVFNDMDIVYVINVNV